jgi:hypothetical protein
MVLVPPVGATPFVMFVVIAPSSMFLGVRHTYWHRR